MSSHTRVKICGMTNTEDVAAAIEAGADAVGFIFYRNSPRVVDPALVKQIVARLPPMVTPVGVFVNEDVAAVRTIMDRCGLVLAQLHGDETAAFCQELGRPVMKALRVQDRGSVLALAEFQGRAGVRGFVLDTFSEKAYGGTGQVFNWELAAEAAKSATILLAGGLTAENVGEAIRAVHPYGVDVSSGVESIPGKKDHGKLRAFLQAVRLVSSA